jgi:uncharacterized FlaG/YvyC family protein
MDVNRVVNTPAPAPPTPTPAAPAAPATPTVQVAPPQPSITPAAPVSEGGQVTAAETSDTTLRRAVSEINSAMAAHSRHLGIRFHEPTNRVVVSVYNSVTNEVVREIPPEAVLDAHANLMEIAGLFVNTRG